MMTPDSYHLADTPKRLGIAGLLPVALMLLAVALDPTARWIVLAAGFGYSAVIFSFIGGVWWGMSLTNKAAPLWIWFAAITPSSLSFILFVPWIFGWDWPKPALFILAIAILASPAIDFAMRRSIAMPLGWLGLRARLSLCLAGLTLILALI